MPIISELIMKSTTTIYTAEEPAGGSVGIYSFNVIQINGSSTPTLKVNVDTRNRSDTSWTTPETVTSITTAGITTITIGTTSPLKELVRVSLLLDTGSSDSWFRVDILRPTYKP